MKEGQKTQKSKEREERRRDGDRNVCVRVSVCVGGGGRGREQTEEFLVNSEEIYNWLKFHSFDSSAAECVKTSGSHNHSFH